MRNHDELTLDKLTDGQRQEVFDAFGPEKDMQLYGRGLRRRLPPMLDGDQRRMRMVYSLLFTLPGTPVLFYGEEIGMGENLDIEGRFAVRTPMQWTSGAGGGFSTADPATFVNPLTEGDYGPEQVNVRDQRRDPDSLLSWIQRLIECYRACPELAWGSYTVLDPGPDARSVLAHRCDCRWPDRAGPAQLRRREGRGGPAADRAGRGRADRRAGPRRRIGPGRRRGSADGVAGRLRMPLVAHRRMITA